MEAKKLENLSLAEYLQIEKEADTRYEYHNGKIFAMAGGTVEHGLISGNTYGEIRMALRRKNSDCTPINSDVKLHIISLNKFLYPDVMVICGEIERSEAEKDAIINPTVIVEVLSQSTESYDRGDKFFSYRQIASLKEYILIDQYKAQIDAYVREEDLWKIMRIEGMDKELNLDSLGITISLKDIYENVSFSDN